MAYNNPRYLVFVDVFSLNVNYYDFILINFNHYLVTHSCKDSQSKIEFLDSCYIYKRIKCFFSFHS